VIVDGIVVCEPRHGSGFEAMADQLLITLQVARVAADPAKPAAAASPGGWPGLRYTRLHGSPQIYRSSYDEAAICDHAGAARAADVESWTIYDNTASGAALPNALTMREHL
jgi:uncharacterized protein YecE (DUF72 family)